MECFARSDRSGANRHHRWIARNAAIAVELELRYRIGIAGANAIVGARAQEAAGSQAPYVAGSNDAVTLIAVDNGARRPRLSMIRIVYVQ